MNKGLRSDICTSPCARNVCACVRVCARACCPWLARRDCSRGYTRPLQLLNALNHALQVQSRGSPKGSTSALHNDSNVLLSFSTPTKIPPRRVRLTALMASAAHICTISTSFAVSIFFRLRLLRSATATTDLSRTWTQSSVFKLGRGAAICASMLVGAQYCAFSRRTLPTCALPCRRATGQRAVARTWKASPPSSCIMVLGSFQYTATGADSRQLCSIRTFLI